tara:strand:- start:796 stop:1029 length:234 start_codon:yes stop_codon:yes gene_type:complete
MIEMKEYKVTFRRQSGEEHHLYADGVSATHATARAWIKFMKTNLYKNSPRHWDLIDLRCLEDGEKENEARAWLLGHI